MLALAFRFDLGRYHAAQWGTHVNEAMVEWPPSPWRILRALYAASRTNAALADRREQVDRALATLAKAPPPSFVLPAVASGHTRHYMPLAGASPTAPDKTSLIVDAFHVLDRGTELVVRWDVDLDARQRSAIAATAPAVGHLGRSESVCTARVLDQAEPVGSPNAVAADQDAFADDDEVDVTELLAVDVQARDPLAALTVSVTDMRKARLRVPRDTTWVRYLVRRTEAPTPAPVRRSLQAPTLAHLRLGHEGRPALTEATTVSHLLRSALQKQLKGQPSPVFSGHDANGHRRDQHAHAHYLALADPGSARIDQLFVWAPEGLGPREVEAVSSLRKLRLREAPVPIQVALVGLGAADRMNLPGLLGPSRKWRSVTPLLLTRHQKRRGGRLVDGPEEQVRRELGWRGLPDPVEVQLIEGRWMEFQRVRPGQSRRDAPRTTGVTLTFADPVTGPIAIGGLSHFGLGLMVPEL